MFLAIFLLSCGTSQYPEAVENARRIGRNTYIRDCGQYGSIEQTFRGRVLPLLEVCGKLHGSEMAFYGRHCYRAGSPWRAKVKVKRVVLDILVACVLLRQG